MPATPVLYRGIASVLKNTIAMNACEALLQKIAAEILGEQAGVFFMARPPERKKRTENCPNVMAQAADDRRGGAPGKERPPAYLVRRLSERRRIS
jgi:hypothetical protein